MSFYKKHLIIKPSNIPKAGQGLFTEVDIAKGTQIVEYLGRISTWVEADYQAGSNPYLFYVNKNHVIDGSTDTMSLARYINDCRGITKVPGLSNNCKFEKDELRVFIIAMKDIKAGSELLVSYGKEYWDIIKSNLGIKEEKIVKKAKAKTKKATAKK